MSLSLLAVLAWLAAAVRVLGIRPRDRGLPWDAERIGLVSLALVAVVFGLHSTIDWTWYVPGNAVPALLCAGWVASRPPLRARLGTELAPVAVRPAWVARGISVALIGVAALVAAWATLQPVRSSHAYDAALDRIDQGNLVAAASIAHIAHQRDPLSTQPLFLSGAIAEDQGDLTGARSAYEQAVDLEPATAETWRRLGHFRFDQKDYKGALSAFQAAFYLDPKNPQSMSDVVVASRAVNGG